MSISVTAAAHCTRKALAVTTMLEKEGYSVRTVSGDNLKSMIVSHPDSNLWFIDICVKYVEETACSAVFCCDKRIGISTSQNTLSRLLRLVQHDRAAWDRRKAEAEISTIEARKWKDRQAAELENLPSVDGVSARIIIGGPAAGRYMVSLSAAGHPLESLTLDQLRKFYALLDSIRSS